MTALVHEVWESNQDGMVIHTCCLAGALGVECRDMLPADSELLITFLANCHFDAMRIYYRFLDREPYSTDMQQDLLAYPVEWADIQCSPLSKGNSYRHGEFTERWFELGLATSEAIRILNAQRDKDDNNPEHLRYALFQRFLAASRPLSATLCWQLYELGNADLDVSMGGTMMTIVTRLAECPRELLTVALASDRKHISRIACRRLENQS